MLSAGTHITAGCTTTANDLTLMQCQTISTIGVMYYIKVISVKRLLRRSINFILGM